jgi:hypothetical protein
MIDFNFVLPKYLHELGWCTLKLLPTVMAGFNWAYMYLDCRSMGICTH